MSEISRMLKGIIEREGISIRGLARAIGVDHASLIRSLREGGNPESRTIEKILDYLGYSLRIIKIRKEVKGKGEPSRTRRKERREK
jgi:DNA-binding phage protein